MGHTQSVHCLRNQSLWGRILLETSGIVKTELPAFSRHVAGVQGQLRSSRPASSRGTAITVWPLLPRPAPGSHMASLAFLPPASALPACCHPLLGWGSNTRPGAGSILTFTFHRTLPLKEWSATILSLTHQVPNNRHNCKEKWWVATWGYKFLSQIPFHEREYGVLES